MVDKAQLKGEDGESEPIHKNCYAIFGVRFLATLVSTKKIKTAQGGLYFFGGGEGNRTPVRKSLDTTFSGCRVSTVSFPRPRRHSGSVEEQPFCA